MSLRGQIDFEMRRNHRSPHSRPMPETAWAPLDAKSNREAAHDQRREYSLNFDEIVEVERRRASFAIAHGGNITADECDRIRDAYAREIGKL